MHISANHGDDIIVFPCQEDLHDEDEFDYARSLFEMSSELPTTMEEAARPKGILLQPCGLIEPRLSRGHGLRKSPHAVGSSSGPDYCSPKYRTR